MEESNFNKFSNLSSICYFQKYFLTTHLNIYKILRFYWLGFWISYMSMPLLASIEQNFKLKNMSKLGFSNYFKINKLKQNVAHVLLTKSCVTWWLSHLDAPMRSWIQTWVVHDHELSIWWCICVHMVQGGHSWVPTTKPSILSHNDVLTCGNHTNVAMW